jgi:hypothetical protein
MKIISGILMIAVTISLGASPAFLLAAHAVSTTICSQSFVGFSHGPNSDIIGKIILNTCGTGTIGSTLFSSTFHNVTTYCIDLAGDNVGCGQDFSLTSSDLIFLGQNNTVTKYFYENTTIRALDNFNVARTFSQALDFAQSHFLVTIHDLRSGATYTRVLTTFVGTSNPFEIDWADYDNDGSVNRTDTSAAQAAFGTSDRYWDFDRDGTVDVTDVARVSYHYGQSFGIANFPSQGFTIKTIDPQWKRSCSIFSDPAKTYCATF